MRRRRRHEAEADPGFATKPLKCGEIFFPPHEGDDIHDTFRCRHCGLPPHHKGDHDENLHVVDITIDHDIWGWSALCHLCRDSKVTEGGFPRDVEKAIRRHIAGYHEATTTYGYYQDGARRTQRDLER